MTQRKDKISTEPRGTHIEVRKRRDQQETVAAGEAGGNHRVSGIPEGRRRSSCKEGGSVSNVLKSQVR